MNVVDGSRCMLQWFIWEFWWECFTPMIPLIYNGYPHMSVNLEKDVCVHKNLDQHRSKGCRLGGTLSNLAF